MAWEMQTPGESMQASQSCMVQLPTTQLFFVCTPDLLDMSRMVLRTKGPQRLPQGYEIILYIPISDADKVGVFHVQSKSFLMSSSAPSSLFVVLLRSLQALFFPSLTWSSPCSSNGTSEANHALCIPWKTLEINKQRQMP